MCVLLDCASRGHLCDSTAFLHVFINIQQLDVEMTSLIFCPPIPGKLPALLATAMGETPELDCITVYCVLTKVICMVYTLKDQHDNRY